MIRQKNSRARTLNSLNLIIICNTDIKEGFAYASKDPRLDRPPHSRSDFRLMYYYFRYMCVCFKFPGN
jgi:hypothetical protein